VLNPNRTPSQLSRSFACVLSTELTRESLYVCSTTSFSTSFCASVSRDALKFQLRHKSHSPSNSRPSNGFTVLFISHSFPSRVVLSSHLLLVATLLRLPSSNSSSMFSLFILTSLLVSFVFAGGA